MSRVAVHFYFPLRFTVVVALPPTSTVFRNRYLSDPEAVVLCTPARVLEYPALPRPTAFRALPLFPRVGIVAFFVGGGGGAPPPWVRPRFLPRSLPSWVRPFPPLLLFGVGPEGPVRRRRWESPSRLRPPPLPLARPLL